MEPPPPERIVPVGPISEPKEHAVAATESHPANAEATPP